MSGHRRRSHRRERPPRTPQCPEEPTPRESPTLREVAVVEFFPSKKTCHASSSSSTTTSVRDVWADLLDSLLHQIIPLLSSFHDLLAFVGTCRSWRAALSSLPSAFSFDFPPLHLQPDIHPYEPRRGYCNYKFLSCCRWQLTDPAKRTSSFRCSAPQNLKIRMHCVGCSYGYIIFTILEQCILVDAYRGTDVRPPKLKSAGNQQIYYGTLVAALNSPNSQLLLCSRSSIFQWQVGTNSWLVHPFDDGTIVQIVSFKGAVFAMDSLERLHRIHLAPQFSMQAVAVVWEEDMVVGQILKPWLVVCGDMLLLVNLLINIDALHGISGIFRVFRLDFSGIFRVFRLDFTVEPAKWVKVDNLGSCALFISFDRRNQTFSSVSPERWGGKSNCIYIASRSEESDEAWTMVELGQAVPNITSCSTWSQVTILEPYCVSNEPENLWVLPSFVYGFGQ